MKMIVGLGNPGSKYLLTPHNIGWIVLDALARYLDLSFRSKGQSLIQNGSLEGQKILLIKPQSYMNASGLAVKEAMDYFQIQQDDLLVIHDDIDLPFLSMKFQKNRGPAGHNGVKNIIEVLHSQDYTRLRIGVALPMKAEDKESLPNQNYRAEELLFKSPVLKPQFTQQRVLKTFTKEEQNLLPNFLNESLMAIQYFLREGLEKVANLYNSKETTKQ